jgi:hypothetical protein
MFSRGFPAALRLAGLHSCMFVAQAKRPRRPEAGGSPGEAFMPTPGMLGGKVYVALSRRETDELRRICPGTTLSA